MTDPIRSRRETHRFELIMQINSERFTFATPSSRGRAARETSRIQTFRVY